jgi:hypothetical protein
MLSSRRPNKHLIEQPSAQEIFSHQLSQLDDAMQREATLVAPQVAAADWRRRYHRYLREGGDVEQEVVDEILGVESDYHESDY